MSDKLLVPFEHEGLWWRPAEPDERLPGTLSYDPVDGCRLSLLGQFSSLTSINDPLLREFAVLHGVVKDAGDVTLFDNLPTTFQIKIRERIFPPTQTKRHIQKTRGEGR